MWGGGGYILVSTVSCAHSNTSLKENSLKLCMLVYCHMVNCISLQHLDVANFERVISLFYLEYFIKIGGDICKSSL
jgi:hypothetical protein